MGVGRQQEIAEMQMIRWRYGISMKDRRTNEELRRLVEVEPITTVIRSCRLRWYGHVMRKRDEDWVKKCMVFRVEGRKPVGRMTWLESVEVDMVELVLSWVRVRRVRWGRISSELIMCGGGVRSILLLPLVARCIETIDVCIWSMFVFMSVVVTVWARWECLLCSRRC